MLYSFPGQTYGKLENRVNCQMSPWGKKSSQLRTTGLKGCSLQAVQNLHPNWTFLRTHILVAARYVAYIFGFHEISQSNSFFPAWSFCQTALTKGWLHNSFLQWRPSLRTHHSCTWIFPESPSAARWQSTSQGWPPLVWPSVSTVCWVFLVCFLDADLICHILEAIHCRLQCYFPELNLTRAGFRMTNADKSAGTI